MTGYGKLVYVGSLACKYAWHSARDSKRTGACSTGSQSSPPTAQPNSPLTDTCSRYGRPADWATLKRFIPYLWPKDAGRMRARVVLSFVLVLVSKAVIYLTSFAYAAAIDRMVPGRESGVAIAVALVAVYAGARFLNVLFDNLRNTVFERVGQDATRHLSEATFRHLHALSLRFHLERRTGAVTKVIERGTKSIDSMLYFLLFNIAPTLLDLVVISTIFGVKFGAGLVAATLVMVVAYIWFTRGVTDWRA